MHSQEKSKENPAPHFQTSSWELEAESLHSASCIQTLLKWSVAASDAKKKVVKNSPMGGKKRWPFSTPFCISRECLIQTPDFIFYAPRLAQSSYTHAQSLTSFSPGWSHRSLFNLKIFFSGLELGSGWRSLAQNTYTHLPPER